MLTNKKNVPFGELDPARQAQLVSLYKRRYAPNTADALGHLQIDEFLIKVAT